MVRALLPREQPGETKTPHTLGEEIERKAAHAAGTAALAASLAAQAAQGCGLVGVGLAIASYSK